MPMSFSQMKIERNHEHRNMNSQPVFDMMESLEQIESRIESAVAGAKIDIVLTPVHRSNRRF